jgi:hypothetical protein
MIRARTRGFLLRGRASLLRGRTGAILLRARAVHGGDGDAAQLIHGGLLRSVGRAQERREPTQIPDQIEGFQFEMREGYFGQLRC